MLKALASLSYRLFIGLRSRWYILYYRTVHGVQFGPGVRIYSKLLIYGPGRVVVGAGTRFTSRRATNELSTTSPTALLSIGEHCLLNGAIISCAQSITIGDRCIIAEAYIRDTSSHGVEPELRHVPGSAKIAPVVLAKNVWIGSHSHVMPGVRIGENTVLGVNSVATKSLPDNVFAAGAPAKPIHPLPGVSPEEQERDPTH